MSIIRKIRVGVLDSVILFLPKHKRQIYRVAFLKGLLAGYNTSENEYYDWRDEMIIRAKVTGQTASLQWYLNHLYDPVQQRILITDTVPVGDGISLESENMDSIIAGIETESGEDGVPFYLEGESNGSLPKDFRVLAPSTINEGLLKSTINLYNIAHKSYDVVLF